MPKSKSFLPDVNVWLALVSKRHVHNRSALLWFESAGDDQTAFCRITQMGLLRLLTNQQVMGVDVFTLAGAWKIYNELIRDSRVRFLTEPAGIEDLWRQFTQETRPATNVWTDAYLQAFAQLKNVYVVSFDRGFRRFEDPEAVILG